MSSERVWYLEERALQLAIVHLTRRNDLVIHQPQYQSDFGIDWLVEIVNNGLATGRLFGVEVKARKKIRSSSHDNEEIKIEINPFLVPKDLPFPLCLFVFDMETDKGYFRWIMEPTYGLLDAPYLAFNQQNIYTKLDKDAIDNIVETINNWYTRKQTQLSQKPSLNRKTLGKLTPKSSSLNRKTLGKLIKKSED